MKEKIILLTPVFNDWESLSKLLSKINKIFDEQIKTKFELIIVNDSSKDHYDFNNYKLKMIEKITVLSLNKNVGSQRAIAIGIKYISNLYRDEFKTIIMDSDGQDNPDAIKKMITESFVNPECSIVINRGQRKEPAWFKIFYELYGFLIKILCFKKIRFGNFSLLNSNDLKKLSLQNDLWGAFPPTVSKNLNKLIYLTYDREKRYGGESKMNFFGLVLHALKVFSVLKLRIFIFSLVYSIIIYLFFQYNYQILSYLIYIFLLFLNLSNLIISFNNEKNYLSNYESISEKTI